MNTLSLRRHPFALRRRAGVGQVVSTYDPTTGQISTTSSGAPGTLFTTGTDTGIFGPPGPWILMGLGGLATLVGIAGAVFSEQYRKQFAIAAGVGLLADLLGAGILAAGESSLASQQAAQIQNQPNPLGPLLPVEMSTVATPTSGPGAPYNPITNPSGTF